MKKNIRPTLTLLLVLMTVTAACQLQLPTPPSPVPTPSGVEISFETIEVSEGGGVVEKLGLGTRAHLLLLTAPDEIVELEHNIYPQAYAELQQIDFEQFVVIALFRGRKPTTDYQTVIEQVWRQDNRLLVYAQFWEPSPVYSVGDAATSPYHLVKVARRDLPSGQPELVLVPIPLTPTPPSGTPGEVEVPFETIALNDSGGDIDITLHEIGGEPQVLLLTGPDQLPGIESWVNPPTWAALQQVDFQHDAVIALFRGHKPSSNYQTIIERITRQADRLMIHAQFWEPSPHWASTAAETFPYHIVKIARHDVSSGQLELVLAPTLITPTPPTR